MISLLCAAASLTNFSKYFLSDRLFYLPGGFQNCDDFYVNFIFIYVIWICHTQIWFEVSKHGQKYDQLFVIVMLPDSRRRRLGNVLMFPLNQVNQLALGVKNTLRWNLGSHIYSLLGQPSCPDFRFRSFYIFPIFRSVSGENSIFCPQAFAAWLARRDKLLKPFDHPVRNSVYDEKQHLQANNSYNMYSELIKIDRVSDFSKCL